MVTEVLGPSEKTYYFGNSIKLTLMFYTHRSVDHSALIPEASICNRQ